MAVYLHGSPGAPEECARFDGAACDAGVQLLCLDRGGLATGGEGRFRRLAEEIVASSSAPHVHLIGFSLGAFAALQVAPHLGARVASLDLVSAAAPLELGDFLDGMAGKPVFSIARRSPWGLSVLSAFQGWLARHARKRLFEMLFATAAGADRDLAADPAFRAEIGGVLDASLNAGRAGYLHDVLAYVRPWAGGLAAVEAPTRVWHGLQDNWAPVAMAQALDRALPGPVRIEIADGLSHYSCLHAAMPRILAQVGGRTAMTGVELKPAAEADYPAIIALTNRAFRETGPKASWNVEDLIEGERINESLLRDDLATPGAHLLIWRDANGEHLGHVRMDEHPGGRFHLGMLTVRPDRQDEGLGRRLLAASEDWARARGGRTVDMTVIHQRETLIAWYVRRGYVLTGETKPFPYDDTRFGRPTRPDLYFDVLEKGL